MTQARGGPRRRTVMPGERVSILPPAEKNRAGEPCKKRGM